MYRRQNKKGYTIFLILVPLAMILFWRLISSSSEMVQYMRLQKKAMDNSRIILAPEKNIYFQK